MGKSLVSDICGWLIILEVYSFSLRSQRFGGVQLMQGTGTCLTLAVTGSPSAGGSCASPSAQDLNTDS